MKQIIHIKNTFRTTNTELLRKAVTEKVEKLINVRMKQSV